MFQFYTEARGPFEKDPYFNEAREELSKIAREIASLPDTNIGDPKGIGYLIAALSHWQECNWNVHNAVQSAQEDDRLLETVFSFLPDHLMILINGSDILLKSNHHNVNISTENDGFTLTVDQFDYFKNSKGGKTAGARRKITRKYRILMPYDWGRMEGAMSSDGTICLKVPVLQIKTFCNNSIHTLS